MRRVVPLIIGGVVGAAILVWALSQRDRAQNSRLPEPKTGIEKGTQPQVQGETLRALANDLSGSEKSDLRKEIRGLIRQAAQAYRERDAKNVKDLMDKITGHGSSIQRILAELILESTDKDEQTIGALALEKVATKEIAPFALALVQSGLPDEVKSISVKLLTKYEVTSANGSLQTVLFGQKISTTLQKQIVLYFTKMSDAPTLARAAVEQVLDKAIRSIAAQNLANLGTEQAAWLLLEAWKTTFVATTRDAHKNGYLLKALSSMNSEILRKVVLAYLETETNLSRRNFIFAMIARADQTLALETLRNALESETAPQVRTQVIAALGAVGGKEAQTILLELLSSGEKDEVLASLNALLLQKTMDVPFGNIVALFEGETDPVQRTVLGSLLAKYADTLESDQTFADQLLTEASNGINSTDLAVRGLSINLYTALAKYTEDPSGSLIELYSGLNLKEQAAHPTLFQEITKLTQDEKATEVVENTLNNSASSTTLRWQAADALFSAGNTEPVYNAIASENTPEMMDAFVGIALTKGGDSATKKLTVIAGEMKESPARNVLMERLRVWTTKDEFQVN